MADLLEEIVQITITANASAPTRKSFGVPAVAAYHTHNSDRIRTYGSLDDMVSDGFTTTEPAYLMASSIVQQSPRPPKFKVIRLSTAVVQTFTFKATNTTDGDSVGLTLLSPGGVLTECYHTNGGAETTTTVATAVAALIAAIAGIGATSATDTVTATADTAGDLWYPSGIKGGNFRDNTPTASVVTDLTATVLIDNDWYGLTVSYFDRTNIAAAASFVSTDEKLLAYSTVDEENTETPPSGVMGTLKALGYKRVYGQFTSDPSHYCATGLMAQRFTALPGSDTWAYKTISGCPVDTITPTQRQNIQGNNGNFYTTVAGISATVDGRSAHGQYIDLQRGLDALKNDIQIGVWDLLSSVEKVPYTEKGIGQVGGRVSASLAKFVRTGFLSSDPGFEPVVLLPAIADVDPVDKKARILRSVTFTATAQGAIHTVIISGTVNF